MDTALIEMQDTALPLDLEGNAYSPHDLALCSTDEARALLPYENAVRMRVLPIAIVGQGTSARLQCALAERSAMGRSSMRLL
jgi:hypothetical protein